MLCDKCCWESGFPVEPWLRRCALHEMLILDLGGFTQATGRPETTFLLAGLAALAAWRSTQLAPHLKVVGVVEKGALP